MQAWDLPHEGPAGLSLFLSPAQPLLAGQLSSPMAWLTHPPWTLHPDWLQPLILDLGPHLDYVPASILGPPRQDIQGLWLAALQPHGLASSLLLFRVRLQQEQLLVVGKTGLIWVLIWTLPLCNTHSLLCLLPFDSRCEKGPSMSVVPKRWFANLTSAGAACSEFLQNGECWTKVSEYFSHVLSGLLDPSRSSAFILTPPPIPAQGWCPRASSVALWKLGT